MGLSYAVLKLCCLDATPDSKRSLRGKPFWLALWARLKKQPWFLDTELQSHVVNKGYQEDMTLERLSASNSSFCNFFLNSFKLYFHFSKKHWKSYFIVMLKKLPFMKRSIVQVQKEWSCYSESQGNLEQWSGVSVLTSRDIKPNHYLLSCHFSLYFVNDLKCFVLLQPTLIC